MFIKKKKSVSKIEQIKGVQRFLMNKDKTEKIKN